MILEDILELADQALEEITKEGRPLTNLPSLLVPLVSASSLLVLARSVKSIEDSLDSIARSLKALNSAGIGTFKQPEDW
jgi:hypothetical protein